MTPRLLAFTLTTAVLSLLSCSTLSPSASTRDVVTQVSTYDALNHALYEGAESLESLRSAGDFGLGTLEGWNGEIVLLDGIYYLIGGDGKVSVIKNLSARTPFLELTWFDADRREPLPAGTTYETLKKSPQTFLPDLNAIYAVKIEGTFRHVKTRSMPVQTRPYKPMRVLVKTQPTFEFDDVEGTMVGFWSPVSMQGVALSGWHLHFITKDRQGGGHVLEFTTKDARMLTDRSLEFRWRIPDTPEYRGTDFAPKP